MVDDTTPITVPEVPTSLINLVERYNRKWMQTAFEFTQAERSITGTEKLLPWFQNIDVTDWNRPFFRTLDGKDHTTFVIDIDIDMDSKTKRKLDQIPGRSREILLAAGIKFFFPWQREQRENYGHEFFWKISFDGIHAIQWVPKRISRNHFEVIVTNLLFPQCSMIGKKVGKHTHKCSESCDGWHFEVRKKDKAGRSRWIQADDPRSEELVRYINYQDYKKIRLAIDLRMYRTAKRQFRWVWSPCFKIAGITTHSVPIRQWDIDQILEQSRPSGVIVEPYEIPEFSFWQWVSDKEVDKEDWKAQKTTIPKERVSHEWTKALHLYEPEQKDILPTALIRKMNKIDQLLINEKSVAPCILQHHQNIIEEIGDHHHSRYIICRFLGSFIDPKWGRKWGLPDLSISDIANWLRFRVNDDKDNSPENRWKLRYYMGLVFEGGNPEANKVPSCSVMQNSQVYGVCNYQMSAMCGRPHPLSQWKKSRETIQPDEVGIIPKPERDDDTAFRKISQLIYDLFKKRQHSVAWKATRAGVTTSAIVAAAQTAQRILVVVPTNKIATDTFTEALNITHRKTGQLLSGAILASNKIGCLSLVLLRHKLDKMKQKSPDWGERGVAYNRMPFHSKPPCMTCKYNRPGHRALINIPQALLLKDESGKQRITPLYNCNVVNYDEGLGDCAYLTFSLEISDLHVVFITYKKLYALMMQETRESENLRNAIMDNFDILILDEVSHFAGESDLTLPVIKGAGHLRSMTDTPRFDLFSRLREEKDLLLKFEALAGRDAPDSISQLKSMMLEFVDKFISEYEPTIKFSMINKEWVDELGTQIWIVEDLLPAQPFEHCLTQQERDELRLNYRVMRAVIENYTKIHNVYLQYIDHVLLLMQEAGWVVVNTPTLAHKINISFIAAPKTVEVKGFVQRFANLQRNRRVIATDATMPEVNLSDFLEVEFQDFVVGDPRGTNKTQLLISDTRNVRVTQLVNGIPCREDCGHYSPERCRLHPSIRNSVSDHDYEKVVKTIRGKTIRQSGRNVCHRYLFELFKDINHVCKIHGAHNVIVVTPNKDVYELLLRSKRFGNLPRNHPQIEVTYYRSDKTIGVECDRRVMVCVCSPLPPQGSHHWLAYYYQRDGLMLTKEDGSKRTLIELGELLRKNAIRQAFWQTIGRAKSPDCSERSAVYCWGISAVERSIKKTITSLNDLMKYNDDYMKDTKPHVFLPLGVGHWNQYHHGVIRYWRERGELIPPQLVKIIEILDTKLVSDSWISASHITKAARLDAKYLFTPLEAVPEEVLNYLGIEMQSYVHGGKYRLKFRRVDPAHSKLFFLPGRGPRTR